MPSKARLLGQIWRVVLQLNPSNVTAEASRRVRIGLVGPVELLQELGTCLLGDRPEAYDMATDSLLMVPAPPDAGALALLPACDLVLLSDDHADSLPGVSPDRVFHLGAEEDFAETTKRILREKTLGYAHLPLARAFLGFRAEVATEIIQSVSVENAVFVASTSLGNIIPNPLQPLASIAESVGDVVVLTANQIRMLFRLAAAHGRELGLTQQAPEVISIVGAAFGWRSIARELVSKIPFGGGVAPKAAIAFAGTWAVGESITFYYVSGRRLTNAEMRARFDAAMGRGRAWAEQFMAKLRTNDGGVKSVMRSSGRGRRLPSESDEALEQ